MLELHFLNVAPLSTPLVDLNLPVHKTQRKYYILFEMHIYVCIIGDAYQQTCCFITQLSAWSEHRSRVLHDTRAENQDIKVWPSQQPGFLDLLGAMYVGICKDGKVYSKECVEGWLTFRSGATQVVIGLSELSFSQWHFFLQVIRSIIWSGNFTGLVNRSLVNNSCALLMMGATLPKLV